MADKEAKLTISLKDNVSDALGKVKGEVFKFTAAVGGLIAALGAALREYAQQEAAINKLNNALKNQGIFSEALSTEYIKLANEMQRATGVADEQIIATQALLTTFGVGSQKIREATQAAVDLSAGLGIDLNTATMLVGKAFTGSTEALGRYGLRIDETIPKGEKFEAMLGLVNQRFGGAAQAQLDTVNGKFADLKNRMSDIAEEIGSAVVPFFNQFYDSIVRITDGINQLGGVFNTVMTVGLSILQSFIQGLINLTIEFPALGNLLKLFNVDLQAINASLEEQINANIMLGIQDNATTNQQIMNSQKKTTTQIQLEKQWTKTQAEETAKREKKGREEAENRLKLEITSIQKRREVEEAANKTRQQNFESTLNFISSLSTAKNKQLAAIGKAAGIAQATIDTYRAANLALASAPPPFNFALAAAVVAAGIANVTKIAGVQLAEGGIVMPRSGGTMATIGEAGKSEAVIPLGDDRAREQLQQSGLGQTTVNLNIGYLIGNENNVRELARIIDKELFTLRRNNESVAFEAL